MARHQRQVHQHLVFNQAHAGQSPGSAPTHLLDDSSSSSSAWASLSTKLKDRSICTGTSTGPRQRWQVRGRVTWQSSATKPAADPAGSGSEARHALTSSTNFEHLALAFPASSARNLIANLVRQDAWPDCASLLDIQFRGAIRVHSWVQCKRITP